jgi:hypothetical protein
MTFTIRAVLAAAAFVASAAPSQATVLFADNFDSYTPALTVTALAPDWTITGNIDLVGQVNPFGIGSCPGVCADLDGTTGPGNMTTSAIAFAAGKAITVSFDVSGNQRGGGDDDFIASVSFVPANGGSAGAYSGPAAFTSTGFIDMLNGTPYVETISSGRPFLTYSYWFTPVIAGTFTMSFGTTSADNIGPILDNVLVTQVPEPASWAMMILGLGLVGVASRRRQTVVLN